MAVLLLAGCAGIPLPEDLPSRADVASVPFHAQEVHACGPAAMAMVLGWGGLAVDPALLMTEIYTSGREGALADDLVGGARRHGRLAVPVVGLPALLKELAAGHPVVVFQNLGLDLLPVWHFAVVVGYDLGEETVVLNSGANERMRVSLATFERTWRRAGGWAIVVLPPDSLPVATDETTVVKAAAGLERAGQNDAAAMAYTAVLRRWPNSLLALIGLGNAEAALGNRTAATAAFRRATELHPQSLAARNNLAEMVRSGAETAP